MLKKLRRNLLNCGKINFGESAYDNNSSPELECERSIMLVPYKSTNQKIAMGLLSFMPKEKDVKKLIKTMERYENDPDWKLYLWKEDDFVGVLGISVEDGEAMLQHLCVNPSHRREGIGKTMLQELRKILPCDLKPTKETKSFLLACAEEGEKSV